VKRLLPLLLVPIALAACSKRDPVAQGAESTAGLPAINDATPNATGAPPEKAAPATGEPASAARIPDALQGRWALAPRDCTSTRGDAKGLLVVVPGELRFYESRAVPGPNTDSDADSISGEFVFTGEGQTWTRFETLRRQGEELVRTESNPMASFTYAKCK